MNIEDSTDIHCWADKSVVFSVWQNAVDDRRQMKDLIMVDTVAEAVFVSFFELQLHACMSVE